ncbi:MAG: apolipoprotein N-acyltransferase [Alphaproteobacteria bacterium]
MQPVVRHRWVLGLAGVAVTLGFAPFFMWPLAMVGLAVLWRAVEAAPTVKQAVWVGLGVGMAHQVTALYWLPRAFYIDADRSLVAGAAGGIPAMLAIAVYGALGVALVCGVVRALPVRVRAVGFVVVWVALEVVKSVHPMGFPWLPVGAMWGGSDVLMQGASVAGVHGLSLMIVGVAVLVATYNPVRWRVAAAVLLAVYGFGAVRLAGAPEMGGGDGPMVRLVQPNIQSAHKWNSEVRMGYLRETLGVAYGEGSQLARAIFMPETAVAFYLQEDPEVRKFVASGLYGEQALVTGSVRRDGDDAAMTFYNGLTVVHPDATLGGWYDKQLLVPFGEYIPLREVLDALPLPMAVRVMSQSRLDFTAGVASPLLPTPVGYALGLICYEGIFPYHVARYAYGARYLLNITNDNWFTGTTALAQHATLERLRAVETGLPLVRVANTGRTLMVDGYGRVVKQLPISTPAALDVALPPALEPTPFVRLARYF